MKKTINIEIQYFSGCPNSQKMLDNVKNVIDELDFQVNYKETLVENIEAAKKTNFRGSPTLIINGVDFENMMVPELPSLSCRYYSNGIPTSKEINDKINMDIK